MSCSAVANIRIEPVNVTWEIEEQFCIETVAESAGDYDGTSFIMYDPAGTKFRVWFDLDGGSSTPVLGGETGVEVNVASGASANTIASAIQAAIDALATFVATVDGNTVKVTCSTVGAVTAGVANVDTDLFLLRTQEGGSLDCGLLDGDVEVSFEEQTLEVTAHQSGTTLRAELRQGVSAEVSLTFKESDMAKFRAVFVGGAGGTFTPGGGTELFGWGSSKQGLNTVVQARRLIFHPVALDDSDLSRDLCFWKAYPIPESLTYSGENPLLLSCSFKCYLDEDKSTGINLFAFGDHSQSGL